MKERKTYVLQLPYEIDGDRFYFSADDDTQAEEYITKFLKPLQEVCEHAMFKNGKCTDCDLPCEHDELDNWICIDCGANVAPTKADYLADQADSDRKEL